MRLKIIGSLSSLALMVVLTACAGNDARNTEGNEQADQQQQNCRTIPRTGKRTGLRVCED